MAQVKQASPKFGTFICLNCAGTHRGLGVHISFVRSITMDAFKTGEIARMEHGGNESWKTFFDNHPVTLSEGRTFEDSTIKERYDGEVGEEWKERLAAKAEGREYVPGQRQPKKEPQQPSSRSSTPLMRAGSGRGSPASQEGIGRSDSRKERNEAYFARLGDANSSRSASLPPSQGGKFTGFGGGMPAEPAPVRQAPGGNIPGFDDFQKDPVASLTKGFGWFTTAVGKSAKTLNDSYLQPTAKTVCLKTPDLLSIYTILTKTPDSRIRLRRPSPPPRQHRRPKPADWRSRRSRSIPALCRRTRSAWRQPPVAGWRPGPQRLLGRLFLARRAAPTPATTAE